MVATFAITELVNLSGEEYNDNTLVCEEDLSFGSELFDDSLSFLEESFAEDKDNSSISFDLHNNVYQTENNRSFASELSTSESYFEDAILDSSVSCDTSFTVSSPVYVSLEEIDALFNDKEVGPLASEQSTSFPSILDSHVGIVQTSSIHEINSQSDEFASNYKFDLDFDIQELQDQDQVGELSELPQEIVLNANIPDDNIVNESALVKPTRTIKRAKRPKPQFAVSASLFHRINNYWSLISQNNKYLSTLSAAVNKWASPTVVPLQAEQFINNVVPALLPNYVNINFFKDVQGKKGWYYEDNKKRQGGPLALRWCGQELNFYDPFIIRYQVDETGKQTNKQALCPYCPVETDMDLDNIFHTTQDSLYMHHVCKDHGVYSTGYEMSPPLLAFENGTPVAFCTECEETCKIVGLGSGVDNCMISYFRHAFISHNKKKQKRTREQKQSDHVFFNGARKHHIYENFETNINCFESKPGRVIASEPEDLLDEKYLDDVIMEDSMLEIDEMSDADTSTQLVEQNWNL